MSAMASELENELKVESPEERHRLLTTMDAVEWAKEFVRLLKAGTFKEGVDEDLMRSWFACAIMTGYDHGARHAEARLLGTKEEPCTIDELRGRAIEHALRLYDGNKSQAAQHLGIDRRTLYRQCARRTQPEAAEQVSECTAPDTQ